MMNIVIVIVASLFIHAHFISAQSTGTNGTGNPIANVVTKRNDQVKQIRANASEALKQVDKSNVTFLQKQARKNEIRSNMQVQILNTRLRAQCEINNILNSRVKREGFTFTPEDCSKIGQSNNFASNNLASAPGSSIQKPMERLPPSRFGSVTPSRVSGITTGRPLSGSTKPAVSSAGITTGRPLSGQTTSRFSMATLRRLVSGSGGGNGSTTGSDGSDEEAEATTPLSGLSTPTTPSAGITTGTSLLGQTTPSARISAATPLSGGISTIGLSTGITTGRPLSGQTTSRFSMGGGNGSTTDSDSSDEEAEVTTPSSLLSGATTKTSGAVGLPTSSSLVSGVTTKSPLSSIPGVTTGSGLSQSITTKVPVTGLAATTLGSSPTTTATSDEE